MKQNITSEKIQIYKKDKFLHPYNKTKSIRKLTKNKIVSKISEERTEIIHFLGLSYLNQQANIGTGTN